MAFANKLQRHLMIVLRMALGVATALAMVSACSDTPSPSGRAAITCDPNAPTAFLVSELDDDDGDGVYKDEGFPLIDDEDDDIADHAWIRDRAGRFHLFFQNEDHGSGAHIEHYISSDLTAITRVGIALQPNPGGWDSHALWAPHVIEHDNMYYMFYTGTDGPGADVNQRIGVATSNDLYSWTRVAVNHCPNTSGDGCVYECNETWTTWSQPGAFNQQCRDPFVIRDDSNDRWVMFNAAKSTNQFGVIVVAYSPDLTTWTGAGYIDATRLIATGSGGQPTGGIAENAFIMSDAGTYYLTFTDWRDTEDTLTVDNGRTMVQYATSSTLAADPSGSSHWTYRGYTPDPGVNAVESQLVDGRWIMSQSIINKTSGDHPVHKRELRLKCVTFTGNFGFETSNVGFGGTSSSHPLAVE